MTFSPLVERIAGEAAEAWNLHSKAAKAAQSDPNVILLSVGDPDLATPEPITNKLIESVRAGRTHYAQLLGESKLRQSVARYYQEQGFVQVKEQNVAIIPGAQNGLFTAAMCLLSVGDEVVVPEPMYVTYPGVIGSTGAYIVSVSLDADQGFSLSAQDIAKAITPKTKAILLNSPHNPTGAVIDTETLRQIADLCKAHDLWLICDEVYLELYFETRPCSALAFPDISDRTVIVSSLSKSHAMTGWRIGWLIVPEPMIKHVYTLLTSIMYGVSMFVQDAAVTAFEQLDLASEMRAIYRSRRDTLTKELDSIKEISYLNPEGGMFVLLDVRPTGLSASEFANAFYEAEKVSLLAADAFGKSAQGYLRLGLVVPEDVLQEVGVRLRRFLQRLRTE